METSNICIRTNSKYDHIVRHLGYTPVDEIPDNTGIYRKDTELIGESQQKLSQVKVIPDEQLSSGQLSALSLIRAINDRNARASGIFAAVIPAASDRVRTAGLYGRHDKKIHMSTDQLNSLWAAINTGIHEMAHHISGAEDGLQEHDEQITTLSKTIIEQVSNGDYDIYLKNPELAW